MLRHKRLYSPFYSLFQPYGSRNLRLSTPGQFNIDFHFRYLEDIISFAKAKRNRNFEAANEAAIEAAIEILIRCLSYPNLLTREDRDSSIRVLRSTEMGRRKYEGHIQEESRFTAPGGLKVLELPPLATNEMVLGPDTYLRSCKSIILLFDKKSSDTGLIIFTQSYQGLTIWRHRLMVTHRRRLRLRCQIVCIARLSG